MPPVLAFAGSAGDRSVAEQACAAAGVRLMRCAALDEYETLEWQNGACATLVVSGTERPELELLFARLDAWSVESALPVIAVIGRDSVDVAAARLAAPETYLLCEPSREEIVSVLGAAVEPRAPTFHDVGSERNTLQLRKLSEDVDRIARTLATLSADREVVTMADIALEEADEGVAADGEGAVELIRAMLRARRLRDRFFAPELFSDPAWDMLLDLAVAGLERKRVAVSSLCIAASVPPTTALRYIKTMTDAGLFVRRPDRTDGRRVFIELSEGTLAAMLRYLGAVRRTIDVVG